MGSRLGFGKGFGGVVLFRCLVRGVKRKGIDGRWVGG